MAFITGHHGRAHDLVDNSVSGRAIKNKAVGTTDADKVQGYLDNRQFTDFYAKGGEWRGRDHRVIHEMYVVDVLPKEQVKEPHAWFKIVQTIPPGRAFRPESASVCKKDW